MNLWAFSLGLAVLFCMWLVSRKGRDVGGTVNAPPDIKKDVLSLKGAASVMIKAAAALAVLAALAAISIPSYQDYTSKARLSQRIAYLSSSKVELSEAIAMAEEPEAKAFLLRANTDLERATERLVDEKRAVGEGAQTGGVAELIASAAAEIEQAGLVDPVLRREAGLSAISQELRTVESGLLELDVKEHEEADRANGWTQVTVILSICSVFVVVFFVVYFTVLLKHRSGQPRAIRQRLRALLEPLMAVFAIVLGGALVLLPDLDQAVAMWGAGVSGSGVGYWLKGAGP